MKWYSNDNDKAGIPVTPADRVSPSTLRRFFSIQPIRTYLYPAYGAASLGKVAVEVMLQLYLFDFYTRVLGLSPILAGTAFAIAIFWDALSDVVVSFGLFEARRHGVLYTSIVGLGGVVLTATTILLFSPSETNSQGYLFGHLLVAYVLVNTGMTLIDLPQSTLSAELSDDPGERNKLLGSRLGFGIFGLAVGSALPGVMLNEGAEAAARQSRFDSALVLGGLVLATAVITAGLVRARERAVQKPDGARMPGLGEIRGLFRDGAFDRILVAGVIAAVGRTINAALAIMYYRFVLKLTEAAATQFIFPVFTLSIILSIPLWIGLSKKFGKRRPAWVAVAGLGVMGIIAYPILPERQLVPVLFISILGGVLCGAVFLVDSMITDLIDADEARSGKRKESLYFAVWKSGVKIARALAFVVIGFGLDLAGLDLSRESVSQGAEWGIILLFGIVVGLCFVAAGWLIRSADVPEPRVSDTS